MEKQKYEVSRFADGTNVVFTRRPDLSYTSKFREEQFEEFLTDFMPEYFSRDMILKNYDCYNVNLDLIQIFEEEKVVCRAEYLFRVKDKKRGMGELWGMEYASLPYMFMCKRKKFEERLADMIGFYVRASLIPFEKGRGIVQEKKKFLTSFEKAAEIVQEKKGFRIIPARTLSYFRGYPTGAQQQCVDSYLIVANTLLLNKKLAQLHIQDDRDYFHYHQEGPRLDVLLFNPTVERVEKAAKIFGDVNAFLKEHIDEVKDAAKFIYGAYNPYYLPSSLNEPSYNLLVKADEIIAGLPPFPGKGLEAYLLSK